LPLPWFKKTTFVNCLYLLHIGSVCQINNSKILLMKLFVIVFVQMFYIYK
jgi:hypothetical protein